MIAGGNFWDGARQGLITAGLNHSLHEIAGGMFESGKKYDLHVLKDEDGAHGAGHEALAGELRNGKLKYVSKNGGKYMVFELRGEIIKNFNTLNDIYNYYLLLIFETRR